MRLIAILPPHSLSYGIGTVVQFGFLSPPSHTILLPTLRHSYYYTHSLSLSLSPDTRETAAINALLASGALWQLGHDCRDEKLPNCTCKHEGDSGLLNGSFYLHDCSVDIKRAYEIFKEFLRIPNVDASGIVAVHNHDVGSKV